MSLQTSAQPRPVSSGISANDLTMLLVVLIWGANYAIVKSALGVIPPLAFAALRFVGATVLLMPVLLLREGWPKLPKGSWPRLIALGVLGNTLYQPFFVIGLNYTTSANSSLILSSMPLLVALISGFLGTERITRRLMFGIVLAFCGITLVLSARGVALTSDTLLGDFLVLIAMVCWGFYTLGLRTLRNLSTLQVTTLTMLTGMPGLVILGLPDLMRLDWGAVGVRNWGALLYATLLAVVVAYFLWNNSVRIAGSTRTAIFQCVTPLVAALVAWLLLGEHFTWLQALGAALIIAGLLTATLRKNEATTKSAR